MSLVQIDEGYRRWRMKDGSGEFLAKKTEGGAWYHIRFLNNERIRHLASVVEKLAEPIPAEEK